MLEEERIAHQGRLESLIYSISEADTGIFDTDQIQAKTAELKEIYKNRFRHQYSALFPVIKSIYEDTRYDVETLLENLRLIREYVEKEHTASKQFDSLYLPLLKLMDHINLELARLSVFGTNERKLIRIDESFNESRQQLDVANEKLITAMEQLKAAQASEAKLKKQLDNAQENLSIVNNKVENSITQVVSVLSIFAAIVIAFSGGISFLGNVVSSIQNVIIYKSVLICILCGLILFNIVFLMLYVVGKIINRSIFAYCAEEDSNSSSGSLNYQCAGACAKKCSGFNRVRKRLPYVFWVNTVGLGLCLLNVIAWFMRLNNIWPLDF